MIILQPGPDSSPPPGPDPCPRPGRDPCPRSTPGRAAGWRRTSS